MTRKRKRKFRSKTIVISKPAVLLTLIMFCAGIALFMLTAPLSSFFGKMISAPLSEYLYKSSIYNVMPCVQNGKEYKKALSLNIFSTIFGFDPSKPYTVLGGQLAMVAEAQTKIFEDTVQTAAKVSAKAQPEPASPASTPSEQPDTATHPIVEVCQIMGGTQNTDGANKELYINNHTGFDVNIAQVLKSPLSVKPEKGKPLVLIVHTHTTESYTPPGQDYYTSGDSTRTQDKSKSVVKVGDELAAQLKNAGINVIHDTTINDYPSYSGSYKKTLGIIEGYLKKYPSIQMVIDVHRDGMSKDDGTKLKVCTDINGEKAAQVMLVMGTSEGGLKHDNWMENLKLGMRIQDRITRDYPHLARPLDLVKERYNQHATPGSMILEVGTDGNTLAEACAAAKYAGRAIGAVLKEIK